MQAGVLAADGVTVPMKDDNSLGWVHHRPLVTCCAFLLARAWPVGPAARLLSAAGGMPRTTRNPLPTHVPRRCPWTTLPLTPLPRL